MGRTPVTRSPLASSEMHCQPWSALAAEPGDKRILTDNVSREGRINPGELAPMRRGHCVMRSVFAIDTNEIDQIVLGSARLHRLPAVPIPYGSVRGKPGWWRKEGNLVCLSPSESPHLQYHSQ